MNRQQDISLDGACILVLEDDPLLRGVLAELLSEEGYQVLLAERGLQALEVVTREHVDFLIFDVRMEGLNGLDTLASMQRSGLQIPSLAITGFAGDEAPVRALRMGVGEYLRKPFRPDQLLEAVSRLLSENRRQQALQNSLVELRQLTRWSNRVLPGTRPPEERIYSFAGLVADLAEAAGLLPVAANALELACFVLAADGEARNRADCPAWAAGWFSLIEECYDGSGPQGLRGQAIPLEARIVALARAVSAKGATADDIQKSMPGRYDPLLLESLNRIGALRSSDGARRLSLARAMLAGGAREQARELLEGLSASPEASSEMVESCLLLASLEEGQALVRVGQAVAGAAQVGPELYARTAFRAGVLLLRNQRAEGIQLLLEAQPRLAALHLDGEAALARLLSEPLREEDLEFVLRPEHEPGLAEVVDLLVPRLAQAAPSERLAKSQRRLCLRYPHAFPQVTIRPEEGEALAETLRVQSFGYLQVHWANRAVEEEDWRGPLARHVFAYLAAQEKPVQIDTLLEIFWADGAENSRRRLSTLLSTVRRTLQEKGCPMDPVLRSRDRLSLTPRLPVWHDLSEFDRCRTSARAALEAGDKASALALLTRLNTLYTGPYLPGCYMDWAIAIRAEKESQYLEAANQLTELLLQEQPQHALEISRRVLQFDPLNNQAHLNVLQLHIDLGQPQESMKHFHRYQNMLKKEYDLEPSIAALTLFQKARLAIP